MKLSNKKIIFFDLDGTLINSAPDLANSINYMLLKLSKQVVDKEIIHQWIGNGAQMLVKRALSGSVIINDNIDADQFNKAYQIFIDHYKEHVCIETFTYDNVQSTLEYLYKNNYKLAIITNKPEQFIAPILQKLHIEKYFDYAIGGDSLKKKKPDPQPIQHCIEKFNTHNSNCVMIGDSKNDIVAAKAANIFSIGVTYGYNYDEPISRYEPDIIIDDFKQLMEIF